MRLSNKVAIITGAGSGIGRATAIHFAREGARVLVADIDEERAAQTTVEITASSVPNTAAFTMLCMMSSPNSTAFSRLAM